MRIFCTTAAVLVISMAVSCIATPAISGSPALQRLSGANYSQMARISRFAVGRDVTADQALYVVTHSRRRAPLYATRAQAVGRYAEEWFVQNRSGWSLAGNPTDRQHDVRRNKRLGRGMVNGQLKVHLNGNINQYIRDMSLHDNASNYFFVPDDHYEPVRNRIRHSSNWSRAEKNTQLARLKKMGITTKQLQHDFDRYGVRAKQMAVQNRVASSAYTAVMIYQVYSAWQSLRAGDMSRADFGVFGGTLLLQHSAYRKIRAHAHRHLLRTGKSVPGYKMAGTLLGVSFGIQMAYTASMYGLGTPEFWEQMKWEAAYLSAGIIGGHVGSVISGPLAPIGGIIGSLSAVHLVNVFISAQDQTQKQIEHDLHTIIKDNASLLDEI
ncbi:hypothetical protein [Chitinivibrio alkaliphilus]|uniref:Uncharacterized protein n=1 Tax=Chitinivibrio alkaliphilus ACht1 TaxID=1313304 RepID=U7D2P5_9BACT|nr:hypothetical protein [Chitinivibrio alkaliphilus]ERP30784.1 hypothetical protein CALK_2394 [Chitinivibrio alkaliphilus ACht1]